MLDYNNWWILIACKQEVNNELVYNELQYQSIDSLGWAFEMDEVQSLLGGVAISLVVQWTPSSLYPWSMATPVFRPLQK